ncbi:MULTISPECIES: hypothetical protein [Corynebacterium]|uniref:Uncharacterized protein n=2 Tax=Corynebacterium TaxID=1716 RepID=A0A3G6IRG6_9CORY|nr:MULTISPECIES: hypothetical protein [Corynebacterium]AZA08162.1 hypothetical protein CPPEL_00040 [Corynebacterium pseudopelargi]QAU51315.1 hypothetical protein CPELA_00040 [Corynebacterium pelargi]GGG81791.1 hypothetical protein GCM10007338_20710 [Corynebacterium pelargi]
MSPTESVMRGLTPEQVLIIADQLDQPVRNYAGIVALAAASAAQIQGIPVHTDSRRAAAALRELALATAPLRAENDVFAEVLARVFLDIQEI